MTSRQSQFLTRAFFVTLTVTLLVGLASAVVWLWRGGDTLPATSFQLLTAALVATTAGAGLGTWRAERVKSRDAKRSEAYEELSTMLMARFAAKSATREDEAALRARVATWGSAEVVVALADWNNIYDRHVSSDARGTVTLTPQASEELQKATVGVISAIRVDLSAPTVTLARLTDALFNSHGDRGVPSIERGQTDAVAQ